MTTWLNPTTCSNHALVILVAAVILQLSILDVGTPLLLLNSFAIVVQVDVTALMPVGTVKNCTLMKRKGFLLALSVVCAASRGECELYCRNEFAKRRHQGPGLPREVRHGARLSHGG